MRCRRSELALKGKRGAPECSRGRPYASLPEAARQGDPCTKVIWIQIIRAPASMKARLSLGIDLGTSNCAMALTDLETDRTEVLPVPQILAANQLGEKPTLAS